MMFEKREKRCPFSFERIDRAPMNLENGCPFVHCKSSDCGKRIPADFKKTDFMPIVVIGSKGSGKSHFLSVLIHELNTIGKRFGFTADFCDDGISVREYNSRYATLYTRREIIAGTKIGDVKNPIVMKIIFKRKSPNGKKSLYIGFYDVAGEDFAIRAKKEIFDLYPVLNYATGYILLLDPLQIPDIHRHIKNLGAFYPQSQRLLNEVEVSTQAFDIFERLKLTLKDETLRRSFAVCFSKSDAIRNIMDGADDECEFYIDDSHENGILDAQCFARMDSAVKSWLKSNGAGEIVGAMESLTFMKCFFAVSALGNIDKNDIRNIALPAPIRIADPILWLLWQDDWLNAANIK